MERHELDMRKAQLLDIRHQLVREFAIGQVTIAFLRLTPPGPGVDLINGHGGIPVVAVSAAAHPLLVVPGIIGGIRNNRSGSRRTFSFGGAWIGLLGQPIAEPVLELILVDLAFVNVREEQLPHTAFVATAHRVAATIPCIEVADDADLSRIRGPDGEGGAIYAVNLHRMGPEPLESAEMGPLDEEMD